MIILRKSFSRRQTSSCTLARPMIESLEPRLLLDADPASLLEFQGGGGSPAITVSGNGASITSGDNDPSRADDTYFASVLKGGNEVTHSFTINNIGTETLTISVALPTGFTLLTSLDPISPGGSADFTVRLDNGSVGVKSGDLVISSDGVSLFHFRIQGMVRTYPNVVLKGNDVAITNGDASPAANDGTDFGTVPRGQTATRTFTITNNGLSPIIGNLYVPAGFIVTDGLVWALEPGQSDTFTLQLNPSVGLKSGEIRFTDFDCNEVFFRFTVSGSVSHLLFNEAFYRAVYPDVDQAVRDGIFASGYSHYLSFGVHEGRNGYFDEQFYLARHSDVAAAVQTGLLASGEAHYLAFGRFEGRQTAFNEQSYLALNPDVAYAVEGAFYSSGLAHYLAWGIHENRRTLFEEDAYLVLNPDVAQAVQDGVFASAMAHYLAYGRYENRLPSWP